MRLLQNVEGSGKGSKIILCVLLPLPSTDDLISQIVFCIFCYFAFQTLFATNGSANATDSKIYSEFRYNPFISKVGAVLVLAPPMRL